MARTRRPDTPPTLAVQGQSGDNDITTSHQDARNTARTAASLKSNNENGVEGNGLQDAISDLEDDSVGVRQTCECPDDDVRKDRHMEWEKFVRMLNTAFETLPSPQKQYQNVRVLNVYWQHSDVPELREHTIALAKAFDDDFGFKVEPPYELRNKDLDMDSIWDEFNTHLVNSVNKVSKQAENNLYILHYAGHAKRDRENEECFWQPEFSSKTGISWTDFEGMLSKKECDLLFIFDCCYAGGMISQKRRWKRRCELLGATSAKERAGAPSKANPERVDARSRQKSFTEALTERLKKQRDEPGIDVNTLSVLLVRDWKQPNSKLRSMPTYQPLHDRSSTEFYSSSFLESKKLDKMSAQPDGGPAASLEDQARRIDDLNDGLTVVVKLRITNAAAELSVEEFRQMLVHRPRNITGVSFLAMHGLWRSNSSLVILTLPLWLWNLMPANAAYEGISVVRSEKNFMLLPQPNGQLPPPSEIQPAMNSLKMQEGMQLVKAGKQRAVSSTHLPAEKLSDRGDKVGLPPGPFGIEPIVQTRWQEPRHQVASRYQVAPDNPKPFREERSRGRSGNNLLEGLRGKAAKPLIKDSGVNITAKIGRGLSDSDCNRLVAKETRRLDNFGFSSMGQSILVL